MIRVAKPIIEEHLVHVAAGSVTLDGDLRWPEGARAIVLFAHGSGATNMWQGCLTRLNWQLC